MPCQRSRLWSKVKVIPVILSRLVRPDKKRLSSQSCLFMTSLSQSRILMLIFIRLKTNLILVIGRQLRSRGEASDGWIKIKTCKCLQR